MPGVSGGRLKGLPEVSVSRREIILIVCMAIAGAYGAYVFLVEMPGRARAKSAQATQGKAADLDALRQTVTALQAQAGAYRISPVHAAILSRAQADWGESPFFTGKLPSELAAEKAASAAEVQARQAAAAAATEAERKRLEERYKWESEILGRFTYTGFATMGQERLAIINGVEYRVGEEPPPGGCVIDQIEPDKVILRRKGDEGTVTLPIRESGDGKGARRPSRP